MKKAERHLFSILLIMMMLLSFSGFSSFAEGFPVPVSDGASLNIVQTVIEADSGDGMEEASPECTILKVSKSGGSEQKEALSLPTGLKALINPDTEISITPPDGYYISSLSLGSAAEQFPARIGNGYEVRICFYDLLTSDRSGLDSDYLPDSSGNYTLDVICEPYDPGVFPSVYYSSGELGYGYTVDFETVQPVQPVASEVLDYAMNMGMEFEGYILRYSNGACRAVSV